MGRGTPARRARHRDDETNLERVFAAELWRVKGELLLGKARMSKRGASPVPLRAADAAERCFRRALDIAQQQEAASLALGP
jgi:hypothetical protein